MYYFAAVCRICIKNDGKLLKIQNLDVDNVTYYEKLTSCFPNMIFEQTTMKTYLCQNCSNILRNMYDFQKLCIDSERILKLYVLQLEQANSNKNSNKNNLKKLMDDNYKYLHMISKERQKPLEVKWERFGSEIVKEDIKTEAMDFEYVDVDMCKSNCLLDTNNDPVNNDPVNNDPVNNDPVDNDPVNNDPVDNDPVDNEPVDNESIDNESVDNEPFDNEPFDNEPFDNEPVNNDPVIDDPVDIQTVNIQPATIAPVCQYYIISVECVNEKDNHMNANKDSSIQCPNTSETTGTPGVTHKQIDLSEKQNKSSVGISDQPEKYTSIPNGRTRFKCDFCGKCFSCSESLQRHIINIHTGDKLYYCDVCNKKFKSSKDLEKHTLVHTAEKPSTCDASRKCLHNSSNLNVCSRIHIDDNPYECEVRFTHSKPLRTYQRNRNQDKH